jgi:hypothetical protein
MTIPTRRTTIILLMSVICSLGRLRQYAAACFHTASCVPTTSSLLLLGRTTTRVPTTAQQQQQRLFASTVDTDETQKETQKGEEQSQPQPPPPLVKELPVPYNMEEIVSLCKRRGIIFPSSEIYNGYAGFFDYGPIGCELKKNVKDLWWKSFVTQREDVVGVDTSIIHNPATWKSSGTYMYV